MGGGLGVGLVVGVGIEGGAGGCVAFKVGPCNPKSKTTKQINHTPQK